MLKKLLQNFRGIFTSILLVLNLIPIPIFVITVALLSRLLPSKKLKLRIDTFLQGPMTSLYMDINKSILKLTGTQWEIRGKGDLNPNGWYFIMANHQSWLDILVLQTRFNRKIPMLKFFMKQELLWTLPIGGLACYVLDFPFMKRHSKEYLKKHPEQRDKDMQTTKEKCKKFQHIPTTIINFLEGTRFSEQKHKARSSPYKNLLPPKAGGMAFALEAMNGTLKDIIDTTIIYSGEKTTLWDFMCGCLPKITVLYEVLPIPDELIGDYYHDKAFRRHFQQWLNHRWQLKDNLL